MNIPAGVRVALAAPAPAGLPKILSAAAERLARIINFPLRFTELHGSDMLRPAERRRMEPRRMPRRESINLVGAALLRHTDVASLRVGSPRADGQVTPPGHVKLAEETGLSLTRLRRALRDGVRAGYWTRTQPKVKYTNAEGSQAWAAFRVIYRLTDRFFARLGLGRRLERERKAAAERAGERRRIYALALLEARDRVRSFVRKHEKAPPPTVDAGENRARLLIEIKLRLRARWPDWPPERIAAEAERLAR